MGALDTLRDKLPEAAKDIRLNLQSVLGQTSLSPARKWGVALSSAYAARNVELRKALIEEAGDEVDEALLEDAKAAAVLMGMNNVFYRFRHMIGRDEYGKKPARLRMNRLAQPATNKTDFELFSLAVSAINGCEMCLRSHENVVLEGGVTEDEIHDAVRIASVVNAAAVALELD